MRLTLVSRILVGAALIIGSPIAVGAQNANTDEHIKKLQESVAAAQGSADNAWMLVAVALVLMMTGPGLALFYGGLVRKKNVLGTMMQSFILMATVSVIWAFYGYSLAFSHGNPFVGGLSFIFLRGVTGEPNAV